jgi:drug/metabolite transporter (DMT)-like permease
MITHTILYGTPFPVDAELSRWGWLGVSGVVGLALGDAFLFQSFLWIGPRIAMLIMSLAPVLATLLGWIFLGESLTFTQLMGIMLTVGGIAWVVFQRTPGPPPTDSERASRARGLLFAFGGAMGQAGGLVLAKPGLAGDFAPLSANFIRMFSAVLIIWGFTLFQRQARPTWDKLRATPRAALHIMGGAIAGPFIGVTFSMIALQRTQVGIASTLIATTPIFLLPIGYFIFKERFGWSVIVGTLLAIAGVALLFVG